MKQTIDQQYPDTVRERRERLERMSRPSTTAGNRFVIFWVCVITLPIVLGYAFWTLRP